MHTDKKINNAFTVDVEDYYMVAAFSDVISFENWHKFESRVEMNTRIILDMLDEFDVKATFFVLGWIAERCSSLVRDIDNRGHEVASHGYCHRLIFRMTPEDYRTDLRLSKNLLEDITGSPVIGYRAASYSIVNETLWALDILIDEGFIYDSSIFPIRHDLYGIPEANRLPHVIERDNGSIIEFPPSTYPLFGQKIPVAGGGYLRLLPLPLTKAAIKRINGTDNSMAVVYCHPWEIDTGQPRLNGRWRSVFRHYINLDTTMPKLRCLLREFKFRSFRAHLRDSDLGDHLAAGRLSLNCSGVPYGDS